MNELTSFVVSSLLACVKSVCARVCRERWVKCKNEERWGGEGGKLFLFSLLPPPSIFHFFNSPSNVRAITRLKTERLLRWLVPCT